MHQLGDQLKRCPMKKGSLEAAFSQKNKARFDP
jgi:hypothetical protein